MRDDKIKVRFWGTRGSTPSPGKNTIKYGGNTACTEVLFPNNTRFILDAGTGIRELGIQLRQKPEKVRGYIFLSHYHWDHIQGLPFFTPAYIPGNEFTIIGPEHPQVDLEKIISNQMESVYFPVPFSILSSKIDFLKLKQGYRQIGDIDVETLNVQHPGGSLSYRFTYGGQTFVYMTDNELGLNPRPPNSKAASLKETIEFVQRADLLIHDGQYTDEELKTKTGWGHSTWKEAMQLAIDSDVRRLILFHHEPEHSDSQLDKSMEECEELLVQKDVKLHCQWAEEGMEVLI